MPNPNRITMQCMSSTKLVVLAILCLQNSLYTVLRRYSQGSLNEVYSKVRPIDEPALKCGAMVLFDPTRL